MKEDRRTPTERFADTVEQAAFDYQRALAGQDRMPPRVRAELQRIADRIAYKLLLKELETNV